MQNNKNIWLPLLTSVGVGAATFYTMSKNNQKFGQTVSKVVPFITQLTTSDSNTSAGNSNTNGDSQKLGPYGMS